jgi:hypothetical protein
MSDSKKEVYKLGDDLIAVVRELVQLSLLTGTNIVDHLRAVHVEVDQTTNKLVPTIQYVEAYNEMVKDLEKQANEAAEEFERKLVAEAEESEEN